MWFLSWLWWWLLCDNSRANSAAAAELWQTLCGQKYQLPSVHRKHVLTWAQNKVPAMPQGGNPTNRHYGLLISGAFNGDAPDLGGSSWVVSFFLIFFSSSSRKSLFDDLWKFIKHIPELIHPREVPHTSPASLPLCMHFSYTSFFFKQKIKKKEEKYLLWALGKATSDSYSVLTEVPDIQIKEDHEGGGRRAAGEGASIPPRPSVP